MIIKEKYTHTEMQELKHALFVNKSKDLMYLLENIIGLRMLGVRLSVSKDSAWINSKYADVIVEGDIASNKVILLLPKLKGRKEKSGKQYK